MWIIKNLTRTFKNSGLNSCAEGSYSSASGRYVCKICPNGSSELAYLAIKDLQDPDRIEVDHRTTFYPATIRSAVMFLRNN